MKYFLLFLITANSYAGYWCPEKPNEVRFPRPHAGCYLVPENFDIETAKESGGALVIDAVKLAAKNARIAAEQAAREAREAKVSICETLYLNVDSLSTLAQARELLKCLVRDAR